MICLFWLKKKFGCTKKVFLLIFLVQPFFSCHHQSFFFPFWLFCHLNLVEQKKRGNHQIKLILMFHDGTAFKNFFFLNYSFRNIFHKKKIKRTHENQFFFKKFTAGQYSVRVVQLTKILLGTINNGFLCYKKMFFCKKHFAKNNFLS